MASAAMVRAAMVNAAPTEALARHRDVAHRSGYAARFAVRQERSAQTGNVCPTFSAGRDRSSATQASRQRPSNSAAPRAVRAATPASAASLEPNAALERAASR
jgi:hypothetical protein